ncbi:MAG: histidine phosphatase family protein [Rhodocyclaceae bacterium]
MSHLQAGDSKTVLCLVRHGETAWNVDRRLQGHLDVPLNDIGHGQARATAAHLARESARFAACYASDLVRARDTAAALQAGSGLAVHACRDLRERHYGCFQGLTYDEAAIRFPEAYARFHRRDPAFVFPDGGESLIAFQARVGAALGRIVRTHPGQRVLIVTHGGVLDMAYRIATGLALDAPRDFAIANAALNWIAHDDGRWCVLAWGEQDHLATTRDELPNG